MTEEPKPKRKLVEPKPPAPDVYKPSLARARARSLARGHGPLMEIEPGTRALNCPYSDTVEDWQWMVLDTFGTRAHSVAAVFIKHLVDLCAAEWNEEHKEWVPDQDELTTVLHIVAAHRPKNEAEAALAAQMAATHLIFMKLAKRAVDYPGDTRTVAAFARVAQVAALQHEVMARTKGKRSTRQTITVRKENHVHYHVHGGGSRNDAQPHASKVGRPGALPAGASVSGEVADGSVVPIGRRAR